MKIDEIILLSALNDFNNFQYNEIIKLLKEFGNIEHIFDAKQNELEIIISPKKANKFIEFRDNFNFEAYAIIINELKLKNVTILPFYDDKYPQLLKNISNPPLVLFHKGSLMDFSNCIAVVGTRNLSHYGHKMARKLSQELALEGYTIVSGLAKGTDTEAHCGALDVGGKTIAIMANDITEIYPAENQNLSKDILKSGALLSEITNFRKLERSNFVLRNRITSGLSKCIIVIESGDTKGTIHQVRIASEQNKPVFILKPKEIDNGFMKDFNNFLDLGAVPFNSSSEILNQVQNYDTNIISNKIFKKKTTLNDFTI
ncbi:MAG: DNA-protecting protein DprA [Spirochaetes bacterium]|nr:DNA-protecting protein DprA [Spirochaetota bacterium]